MGTNYIAPTWRVPRNANKDKLSNYSIYFNGSNKYIQAENFNILAGKKNFSISIWVNLDTYSGSNILGHVLNLHGSNNSTDIYVLFNGRTTLDVYIGNIAFRGTCTDPVSNWTNLIITFDGNIPSTQVLDRCKVWQDGNKLTNTNASNVSAVPSGADTLLIGKKAQGPQWFYHFLGKISQLAIFDYTLTDGTNGTVDQISYLYNLNNPMAISGAEPIAYWPLGDNSNPIATAGYPNISVEADSVFDFVPNDYIELRHSDSLSFGDGANDLPFSISAWVNVDDTSTNRIVSKATSGNPEYLFTTGTAAKTLVLNMYDEPATVHSGPYRGKAGTTSFNSYVGKWVHVVATYDGRGGDTAHDGINLYFNGVPETTTNLIGGTYQAMSNTSAPVQIGADPTWTSNYMNGQISNVQIWNTELSAPNVVTLYNNGKPLITGTQPQEANLKAWYKLNQSANWSVDDGSTKWQIPDALSAYPKSLIFKETSDTVNINIANLNTTHSINYWIYMVGGGASQAYTLSSGATNGWRVYCNQASLYYRPTGSNTYMIYNTMPYNLLHNPGWHNITITRSGDTVKFYMNGNSTPFYTHTYTNAPALDTLTHISGDVQTPYPGNGADVTYSNFIFTNTEISGSNVTELYNNGRPVTSLPSSIASDVVAWYKFDDTMVFYNNTGQWGIPNSASTSNQVINFSN